MPCIEEFFPSPVDTVNSLAVEEIAWCLLDFFKSRQHPPQGQDRHDVFHIDNFIRGLYRQFRENATPIAEGFAWLESQGFLVRDFGEPGSNFTLSRKARSITSKAQFASLRKAALLPVTLLHPAIQKASYPAFIRGEYETAVFAAFKQVEIAVRTAGNYAPTDIGSALMRKAFDSQNGPLTDSQVVPAERQGLGDLFAGSMGYFRNPTAHRSFPIADTGDAVEMLLLANHLRKIVDLRSPIGPIPA